VCCRQDQMFMALIVPLVLVSPGKIGLALIVAQRVRSSAPTLQFLAMLYPVLTSLLAAAKVETEAVPGGRPHGCKTCCSATTSRPGQMSNPSIGGIGKGPPGQRGGRHGGATAGPPTRVASKGILNYIQRLRRARHAPRLTGCCAQRGIRRMLRTSPTCGSAGGGRTTRWWRAIGWWEQ
jgi:hypothetical protein